MLIHFFKSLNWVDLLMLAILIRIVYIGVQAGVVMEMFKLLGALLTTFVCFHYYSAVARFIIHITKAPWGNIVEVLSFVLLWALMFVVCKLIRDGLFILFSIEAKSIVDKWGGALLGIGRFFIIGSMTMFLLLMPGDKYLEARTAEAFSRPYVLMVAPNFYRTFCDGLVVKVFQKEKPNKAVWEHLKKVESR